MVKNLLKSILSIYGRYFPEQWISLRYRLRFKRFPNLLNPSTLNEKILYLSLKTNTEKWTFCADKYKVREYVTSHKCKDMLVKLYGVYEEPSQIDYKKLPTEFIIKTNHGCGGIFIVKDKNKINTQKINKKLKKSISQRYGDFESGIHYTRIQPRIIIEELLHETGNSSSLIDYKIWCFNGKPQFIFVITNRKGHNMDIMMYDLDWNALPNYCRFNNTYKQATLIEKPKNFEMMLKTAALLASEFPQVRVDLYNIEGKIYFGELTFTSLGGLMTYFSEEFQEIAGGMIDLNYPG